ncbi:MAG TPA: ATP-binding protein [Tenuifilaceae bacterium]|nr:ATP-binding protein [Tenuifilaceae bacterium]
MLAAKEKAEESEKLMSAFLANMSHEVRTPMNGIMGFSQLIQNPELGDEERNEYISIIQHSGNQLLTIINDLIDISKIQSNLITISKAPVNINELLHEQFLLFKPKADSLGLTFSFSTGLANNECVIETDDTRLRQIITNLLGNAFKFTKQGFVKFGYMPKGDFLEFFVEDSGVGVPQEMKNLIFNIFRQVETELSRQTGGTGLGLSISKALVNKMGGEISVESSPNEGSKFTFTIPYNTSTEKKYLTSEFMTEQPKGGKKKILITEDNEINYLYFKQLLTQINAEFSWAANGLEAVEMVRSNPSIDLVLMDIKMPVKDGLEATREIKKIRNDLPIIAQTAYAFESDKEKALAAGCDDYISKPINRDRLIEMLSKYLNR